MSRVQREVVASAVGADERLRPRQSILAALLLAYSGLVALVVVGALRSDEPLVAWVGVAFAIVFLPVMDFYRRAIVIEPDALVAFAFRDVRRIRFPDIAAYGVRRGYVYKSGTWTWLVVVGRDGTRIDIALDVYARRDVARMFDVLRERAPLARSIEPERARIGVRLYAVVLAGTLLIALGLVVAGVVLPRTLEGESLFSRAATLGLVAGMTFGALAARPLLPKLPIVVVVTSTIAAMVVVPAAALFANMTMRAPVRTTRLTVVDHHTYSENGRISYAVDLDVDGVRHRISPPRAIGSVLEPTRSFDACVRDGKLGYSAILSFTTGCGSGMQAPRR
jgi:hypothetical protein